MAKASVRPSRAISIRQPYAELILRGVKKNEFRNSPTHIRGRLFIYAALKPADDPQQWGRAKAEPGDFEVGKIVGTVEIVGCQWDGRAKCYAYRLAKPRRITSPRRPKNQPTPRFWIPRFR